MAKAAVVVVAVVVAVAPTVGAAQVVRMEGAWCLLVATQVVVETVEGLWVVGTKVVAEVAEVLAVVVTVAAEEVTAASGAATRCRQGPAHDSD